MRRTLSIGAFSALLLGLLLLLPWVTVFVSKTPDLKFAAGENARLQKQLTWTFGKRQQVGWSIYVPLIQQLIGSQDSPETEEFAAALAKWQQRVRLEPDGTLDRETLQKMVEIWQSRRLNRSEYPPESELLTAPIADFYDPTRAVELLKVQKETYAAFKKMTTAAFADKSLKLDKKERAQFLKIISAFRSREYQQKLRDQSPGSSRAALAVNSPHSTGRALDIYVGGEPVSTKDENRALQIETPVYKWLVKNAGNYGFVPYFFEPWHWEYVGDQK